MLFNHQFRSTFASSESIILASKLPLALDKAMVYLSQVYGNKVAHI